MSNPVTATIKDMMEKYGARESTMRERVAEANIIAQKLTDEGKAPHKRHNFWAVDRRQRDFDHFFVAHSSLKHVEGGVCSSYKAARYYDDKAAQRRDELLAQFPKE
mmetsp:Transcript_22366/g.31179  ORF Transcript_22366/g.31179 Transcript_22366/m.31179 type:complete len:106 (+) Transcript_22366:134-451(+)